MIPFPKAMGEMSMVERTSVGTFFVAPDGSRLMILEDVGLPSPYLSSKGILRGMSVLDSPMIAWLIHDKETQKFGARIDGFLDQGIAVTFHVAASSPEMRTFYLTAIAGISRI